MNPALAAANPYIIAPNILTLYAGEAAVTVNAELAGGSAADNALFSRRVSDGTVASVAASNESARVRALKEGVTQIIVHHPKAGNIDRTVLLICEPKRNTDCYITVPESIIRMKPSDGARTINAELVGGGANDAYLFKWWADSYDVIDLNYSSASAILRPLGAGYATIHVSHPKAAYQKDIIVYISQYDELSFEKSAVSVVSGSMSFVNMRVPASNVQTKIAYTVKTPGGGDAGHIVGASGTKSVCTLEAKAAGNAVVTASLVAVSSGAVQGTAELLVNVTESNTPGAYIDFAESSILTIEKGVTRTLRARLSGALAQTNDSKSLQWKSSDPDILRIAPASASGVAVNDEVQVTALRDGREATITITHDKAASNVILYCVIPGEASAHIALERSEVNLIMGDAPFALAANITNAESDDYNNLMWTVEQTGEIVKLSGGGKKVNVLPYAVGSAVIRAQVPSSGRFATCRVNIEEPRSIRFDKTGVSAYPGEVITLRYTVSPAADTGTVSWALSDAGIAQIGVDDKAGTLTLFTKHKEGVTRVTGTTARGSSESCVITNGWGNTLALDKSLIKTIPVDNHDGTFTVKYELKPACADLRLWGLSNMILKAGTYDTYGENVYTIKAARHDVDGLSGIARGALVFEPKGESNGAVTVQAWNPQATLNLDGSLSPAEAARQTIQMRVYYNKYTFVPTVTSRAGKYSRYDADAGTFVLGDGETLNFKLGVTEQGGTPYIVNVKERLSGEEKEHIAMSGTGPYMLQHKNDYGAGSGALYGGDTDNIERTNRAVRAFKLAGSIAVTYRLFGESGDKEYQFPLYIEIRNCSKDY